MNVRFQFHDSLYAETMTKVRAVSICRGQVHVYYTDADPTVQNLDELDYVTVGRSFIDPRRQITVGTSFRNGRFRSDCDAAYYIFGVNGNCSTDSKCWRSKNVKEVSIVDQSSLY